MKLVPSTIRSYDHFPEGGEGFLLDAKNFLNPETVAKEAFDNLKAHQKLWAPAKFIRFVVYHRAEGCFELEAEEETLLGTRKMVSVDGNPAIIRKDEMFWLKGAIGRLGKDYDAIKKKAIEGNDDALIIVGYCETAHQFVLYQRGCKNQCPYFFVDQFLWAASECEV